MDKPIIDKIISQKADEFARREYMSDSSERDALSKGYYWGYKDAQKDLALTWEDIRRIVKIADDLLDDPKTRVAFNNHNEEYYYKRVLDEYNKLHQTTKK